jgi:hypothetical protein
LAEKKLTEKPVPVAQLVSFLWSKFVGANE